MRRYGAVLVGLTTIALAVPAAGSANGRSPDVPGAGDLTRSEQARLAAGLQLAPAGTGARGANPVIAYLADVRGVDFAAWRAENVLAGERARLAGDGARARAQNSPGGRLSPVLTYREKEAPGRVGANDTTWLGEKVTAFGSGTAQRNRMVVAGSLADNAPPARTLPQVAEDNGSIPLAADTGIRGNGRVAVRGRIGDGPHGTAGDRSGDFDWYAVHAEAGESVQIVAESPGVDLAMLIVDGAGEIVSLGLSMTNGQKIPAEYIAPVAGTYYLSVQDLDTWQMDPQDSGSGTGVSGTGNYTATLGSWRTDRDAVLVRLRKGDVLGVSVAGAASRVTIQDWDSTYLGGGTRAGATSYYPPDSPLPRGGNSAAAYVARSDGWYGVIVESGVGRYRNTVEVYRPPGSLVPRTQTVFLDFDGARVRTDPFGIPGRATLSPMRDFLSGWGLRAGQELAVADAITARVRENLQEDLRRHGVPNVRVNVVNGLRRPDTYGSRDVSRVIVGGSVEESGIETVGIASAIDPGNFGHEDQALVLLDKMSAPVKGNADAVVSLNYYAKPSTDMVRFVGTAVGNVVAHEVGHYIGNFHTDNSNPVTSLMDSGGAGFWRMFQVGRDRVPGTADDGDTDFSTDRFSLVEGFTGIENTANVSAWAFARKP